MAYIQQAMSYSEFITVRLELSCNFLVPHVFACGMLFCIVTHAIIFWQWRTSYCDSFKIIRKAVVSNFLVSSQTQNLNSSNKKMDSAMSEISRTGYLQKASGRLIFFICFLKPAVKKFFYSILFLLETKIIFVDYQL